MIVVVGTDVVSSDFVVIEDVCIGFADVVDKEIGFVVVEDVATIVVVVVDIKVVLGDFVVCVVEVVEVIIIGFAEVVIFGSEEKRRKKC